MADPVGFEGANGIMMRPPDMTPEECRDLTVWRDGKQIISCWRLTEDELKTVRETGVVWLSILGNAMPPVCIAGKDMLQIHGREPKAEPAIAPPVLTRQAKSTPEER